jgi:Glycosyltransferase family 87
VVAESTQRPLRFLPERFRQREPWLELLAFIALFALYSTLIANVVQNGDAAGYNEQIESGVFAAREIHVGYMALGSAFRAVLPMPTDKALNVMALSFGVAALGALYLTAKRWGSRAAAVGSVLCALGSIDYVRSMVLSEVDILSAALVIIAYACYALQRPILAGAAFGVAMLSTPVTLSFVPLFVFTFALDPRGARATLKVQAWRVLRFGVAGLVLYAPWVIWHWHAYFWGKRGVFTSPYAPFHGHEQIARCVDVFKDNVWGLLPLFLAGLVAALWDRRRWQTDQPAIGIVLSVITTTLLVDRAGDVPVHLPTFPLVGLLACLFLDRLASASRWVWAVPCCAFLLMGVPAYLSARTEVEDRRQLTRTYTEMRNQSRPLPSMLVDLPKGFSTHRFFEHFAQGDAPSLADFRHRLHALESGPEEYVIYFAIHIPRDIEARLGERYVSTVRVVNGDRYPVLVPRSVEH